MYAVDKHVYVGLDVYSLYPKIKGTPSVVVLKLKQTKRNPWTTKKKTRSRHYI